MAAIEKQQGHDAERAVDLHDKIKSLLLSTAFSVKLTEGKVIIVGDSRTKTDFYIDTISVSQKTTSGKNTQIWLPTKTSIFSHVHGLIEAKSELLQFLGSPTITRKKLKDISSGNKLLTAMNKVIKDGSLLKKMFLQVENEEPVQIISWVLKSRSGSGITLIDAQKYVDYIIKHGEWVESPSSSVLWLIDKNAANIIYDKQGNKKYKKFAHLQRKGSPSNDKHKDGQYYAPMFHIHSYWPIDTVISVDTTFNIRGI